MAAADTSRAIGSVTLLLQEHLIRRGFDVSIGTPEEAARVNSNRKLNLFLYEIGFDPHLRNVSIRPGEPPPLWLVLKYLVTAFDDQESSDSALAHQLLSGAVAALHELSYLLLVPLATPGALAALQDNPEPLKLTFDEATADLLSTVMQGTDERYRLSVAFQVRPVMIVPASPSRSNLLVGIDYEALPQTVIGEDGIRISVTPSMGPRVSQVTPPVFEAGGSVEITGDDLHGAGIEVVLGDQVLTIAEQQPQRLRVVVEGAPDDPIASGTTLSAGELPLVVRRRLSATRARSSPMTLTRLLPTVETASLAGADLQVTGHLLGRGPAEPRTDDVVVSLYRDGRVVRTFDAVGDASTQDLLVVPNITAAGLPAGPYRVIVIVNNQQARVSPEVLLP